MGIIEKQATKNVIFSYLGAGLGVITIFWLPRLLSTEENGLIRVLLSFSVLFSQFSNLGFSAVTIRFFPYFRNADKGHHGFLYYVLIVPTIGFLISILFFFVFKDQIIAGNEKTILLSDFIYYLLPLTFFTLFFNVFDTYLRASLNSVIGSFTKEILQRILILTVMLGYFFGLFNFHLFIFLYILSISIPTIILISFIILSKQWNVKRDKNFIGHSIKKEIIRLSFFTVLSEFSSAIIVSVDSLMLFFLLGLSKTGVYSIAFNFGNLMTIPARSISRITSSIIVENFRKNDLKEIASLYKKSCNTQLTIATLLLMGVILNIESFMSFLPEDYYSGKYVILILCVGYFIEMATGLNHIIVVFSKYYKYDSLFIIMLVFLALVFNYYFIQSFGITGAAIATASTIVFGNVTRSIFVYYKLKMQPYDKNTFRILLAGFLAFILAWMIPFFQVSPNQKIVNLIIDIVLRSGVATIVFITLLLKLEAAPDLNNKIRKNLKRFSINV